MQAPDGRSPVTRIASAAHERHPALRAGPHLRAGPQLNGYRAGIAAPHERKHAQTE